MGGENGERGTKSTRLTGPPKETIISFPLEIDAADQVEKSQSCRSGFWYLPNPLRAGDDALPQERHWSSPTQPCRLMGNSRDHPAGSAD
jgi:hypothetical protein